MAPQQQEHIIKIDVPASKAAQLNDLVKLSAETLNILAEKSKKPGIEERLKKFKNLI